MQESEIGFRMIKTANCGYREVSIKAWKEKGAETTVWEGAARPCVSNKQRAFAVRKSRLQGLGRDYVATEKGDFYTDAWIHC